MLRSIPKLILWITSLFILFKAVSAAYAASQYLLIVAEVIFFPVTILVYPFLSGFWWLVPIVVISWIVSLYIRRHEENLLEAEIAEFDRWVEESGREALGEEGEEEFAATPTPATA